MKAFLPVLFAFLALSPAIAMEKPLNPNTNSKPIDRHALVTRLNVVLTQFNGDRPLQVGNGEFAFGMDITGLQSFAPFNTMSQWGWHSSPLPAGKKVEDYQMQPVKMHGRDVLMPMPDPKEPELSHWLTGNPHRINLGRVGLALLKSDGTPATQSDLQNTRQELDLWSGIVTSHFSLEGVPVTVTTACHPTRDAVAARVESPLVNAGRLAVFIDFPSDDPNQFNNFVGNWDRPKPEETKVVAKKQSVEFSRTLAGEKADPYFVEMNWKGKVLLLREDTPPALFPLTIQKAEYGAADKWFDVTEKVSRAVKGNQLSLLVNNAQFDDPIEKQVKSLKVSYTLGDTPYTAQVGENQELRIQNDPIPDRYTLQPTNRKPQDSSFSFVCSFAPSSTPRTRIDAEAVFASSRDSWRRYWNTGGAIDLSESKDPRWKELERRIVLSQYLMKANESGSLPPQESGLVNNGWFGRFHFEMIWWHAAQWALWNRWKELDGSISVYKKLFPQAKELAKVQGYKGARWPKATGPDGREWPFFNHAVMIWQQPHPIFFAEMDYRAHPTKVTLEKWRPIVEATADFLASYAFFDEKKGTYVLGPPLNLVSENTDWTITQDPTFELSFWRTGLRLAQGWRQRLGQPRNPEWEKVLKGLTPLPVQDGVYVTYDGIPDMWTKWTYEHPGLVGALGMLPGDGVDKETMRRTLDRVCKEWQFDRVWGWDFPMLAMCAAKLNEPERAVDMLLHPSPNFQFDERGLATGGPFPYFPSNGALLYAVAQMAAGWDGAPSRHAPGFPDNGQWTVRFENLNPTL